MGWPCQTKTPYNTTQKVGDIYEIPTSTGTMFYAVKSPYQSRETVPYLYIHTIRENQRKYILSGRTKARPGP